MKIIKYLKEFSLSQKILCLIMAVFGCVFYTTFIANHYYFRTYAFDYAVYNFTFWDFAHFHSSIIPCYHVFMNTGMTFLQNHFTFIFIYLIPVYWMLNWLTGSYTLMIIQVTLILWSAWNLYKLIRLKTNDDWLAVISVLYYFLLQGHYSSFTADCNICTMAFCLVTPFLFYFESKKYVASSILLVLLFFAREDISLYFIFIFSTLIAWHWKEKKIVRYCIAGMLSSIICFILTFKVFIPMCETSDAHYVLFQYSALGKNPLEAFLYIINHPINTFKLLYTNPLPDHTIDGVKMEFYMVYFISGGFLLLLRPQYFIWFIPLIAQKMFNDSPIRWSILWYYGDPVTTMLPISVFLITSVFKIKWIRYSIAALVCALALYITWYKADIHNRALVWGDTVKENIFDPKFFHPDYNAAKIHADLKLIPPDAKICASESILPHLSQRKYPYEFPDVEDAEYIAVFTFKNNYMMSDSAYSKTVNKYINNPSWKIIANDPPFLLMKKDE